MRAQRVGTALVLYLVARHYVTSPWPEVAFVVLLLTVLVRDTKMLQRWVVSKLQRRVPAERRAVVQAVAALQNYQELMLKEVLGRRKRLFFMMTPDQQKVAVPTFRRFQEVEKCIKSNASFLNSVAQFAIQRYGLSSAELRVVASTQSPDAVHEAKDLLNHFVRDWSLSRASQRTGLFKPFWKAIDRFPKTSRLLIPGSGLGRLAVEAAARGYTVDAIELSASMVLGSQFAALPQPSVEVYPYVGDFSNWRHGGDQLQAVELEFPRNTNLPTFLYGNFLGFKFEHKYDAVATFFFIDTAQNVFSYIDRIRELLRKGGVWINYGPLKWGTAPFLEPSVDELVDYVAASGFRVSPVFEGQDRYDGSPSSMIHASYRIVGWTAVAI